MKKIIILITLFLMLCLTCCKTVSEPITGQIYTSSMVLKYDKDFSRIQFDSLCAVDQIPAKISKWSVLPIRDFETRENVQIYSYGKQYPSSYGKFSLTLTIKNDTTFRVKKIIIK